MSASVATLALPLPMLLWCRRCGAQHVDTADTARACADETRQSHNCYVCGLVWRPADFPTVGVAQINTRGENDTPDGAAFHYVDEPDDVVHPGMAGLLNAWLSLALDYSAAAQRAKHTSIAEATAYASRSETLAFCSQELFTLLQGVGATPVTDRPPMPVSSELLKIIRYGMAGDVTRVVAYARLLADKVAAAGDLEAAERIRRYAGGDFGLEIRSMAESETD